MIKKILSLSLLTLLFVFFNQAIGADQITIEADYLQIDNKNNYSHYKGNVILKKAQLIIKGSSLKLWQNIDKKITKIIVTGMPASLKNVDNNNKPITASADSIIFEPLSFLLHLNKNAKLVTIKEQFMSSRIIYNTQTQNFIAGEKEIKKGEKSKNRVKIILQQ
ncbi:MAG: lipopolysaccharide transport periplasmic protein LptA [Gammaproteobacteria bacterium]|nr:MAG: lipopolysaccharide transport periplasmic protein LptA [Gammaproteobacteria bacterium]